ncbi:MAG: endonuclease/exonuclease/phosphatase family protein [Pirellulaceae bacterium]
MLLVQIDGLSRTQLERAIADNRLPHLKRLLDREKYRLHTFYSGLPSSTPGVQGELHYGERCAVPAFSFRENQSRRIMRMFEQASASSIESRLASSNTGLLTGGASYCNIYSGGADDSRFCAATIGWGNVARATNLPRWLSVLLWHSPSLLRVIELSVIELALALWDFAGGLSSGFHLGKELKFIPSRVAVSIMLRELTVMGASMDLARGLPIVHLNLLGYDEQAHRRGPGSAFAHWSLKGIDSAVRRLWNEAQRSAARDYDVWVFSDHGQQHTIPYPTIAGKTIQRAIADVFDRGSVEATDPRAGGVQSSRAKWLGHGWWSRLFRRHEDQDDIQPPAVTEVAAMGPVAHVYPAETMNADQLLDTGRRLVGDQHIPMVLIQHHNRVMAITRSGEFDLLEQPGQVLGDRHPFLCDVAVDLDRLVRHPDAGALVLVGWSLEGPPVSFAVENGAHAGPGPEETRAFAILPMDAPLPKGYKGYVRAADLRNAALHLLGRDTPKDYLPGIYPVSDFARGARRLRVMTYNVHACVGMDGRMSPARIARAISQADVDVVALQELDVGRLRSGTIDQAHEIARLLEMEFHFHPAWQLEEELYGDAILSRLPMRLIQSGPLPRPPNRERAEPRGAVWVEIQWDGQPLQVVNTHLGLGSRERVVQAEELLGPRWIGHSDCHDPVILCGDFNAIPKSRAYSLLAQRLRDAQRSLVGHRPRATFLSGRPINRIDHVFVGPTLQVRQIEVPRSELARVASDHLPLIVELEREVVRPTSVDSHPTFADLASAPSDRGK